MNFFMLLPFFNSDVRDSMLMDELSLFLFLVLSFELQLQNIAGVHKGS